ncbi:hypothetical protein X801_08022, partial [Opisthorchis viverrini]
MRCTASAESSERLTLGDRSGGDSKVTVSRARYTSSRMILSHVECKKEFRENWKNKSYNNHGKKYS